MEFASELIAHAVAVWLDFPALLGASGEPGARRGRRPLWITNTHAVEAHDDTL
jgi:hypothetical protein